jgi:branched-chain amino acid transport system permease protein
MLSVREDEIAAETMGVNSTKYKVMAFTIGAAFAGLAGGLYSHYMMFIDPKSFTFTKSIETLTMVVLGGLGSMTGSISSAVVLTFLPEWLRPLAMWRMVIYSCLLIAMMLGRPQGLLGNWEIWYAFKALKRKKNEPLQPGRGETHGATSA